MQRVAAAAVAVRKREVRARLLAARRALPVEVRADAARAIHAAVAALARSRSGETIAGYVPMPSEPGGADLPGLLAEAAGSGGRLLLPLLREDRDLDWTAYGSPKRPPAGAAERSPRSSGRDPEEQHLGPEAIREATLLVVPALAVDRSGIRLGRGGGSYDRALVRLAPGAEVVALLHDGEFLDHPLPAEPHDRRVTAVVTPRHGLLSITA